MSNNCETDNKLPSDNNDPESTETNSQNKSTASSSLLEPSISATSIEAEPQTGVLGFDPETVVFPPPPEFKCPGRGQWTNQLKYLLTSVIKPIIKLKCALSFKDPVNPIVLRVPTYYVVIKKPMDLSSIKKRLEHNYYLNAQECIDDVNQMLSNCYKFNKPEHPVFQCGKQLEEQFKSKMLKMPQVECPIPFTLKFNYFGSPSKKRPPYLNGATRLPAAATVIAAAHSASQPTDFCEVEGESVDEVVSTVATHSTQQQVTQPLKIEVEGEPKAEPPLTSTDVESTISPNIDSAHKADTDVSTSMASVSSPISNSDEVESSQVVTTSGIDAIRDSDLGSPDLDDRVHSTQSEASPASNTNEELTTPTDVSVELSFEKETEVVLDRSEVGDIAKYSKAPPIYPRPLIHPSKTESQSCKRKADTTTPNTPIYSSKNALDIRTSSRKIKKPNKELPGESDPFSKSYKKPPLSGHMRFCSNLLKELLGKQHYEYAWPFYEPVDVVALGIPDYYEKIKKPMDLGSIKKKMETRQYRTPADFANDVRLVFTNCYTYNPPTIPVYNMAERLHNVFETKFAKLPSQDHKSPFHHKHKLPHSTKKQPPYSANYVSPTGELSSARPIGRPVKTSTSATEAASEDPTDECASKPTETPELNAISQLQKQLQQVMMQLTVIQKQQGSSSVTPSQDAKNLQQQLDSLTGKKPRATPVKRQRKKQDSSSFNTSSSAPPPAPSDQGEATNTLDVSTISANSMDSNASSAFDVNTSNDSINHSSSNIPSNSNDVLGPGKLPETAHSSFGSSGFGTGDSQSACEDVTLISNQSSTSNAPGKVKKEAAPIRRKKPAGNNEGSPPAKKQAPNVGTKQSSKLKTHTARPRPPGGFESDDDDFAKPMTYDEKRQLSSDIDKLTSDKLTKLVHIIRAHEPSLRDTNVSEIVVDLETVKATTLRALEKFVGQCLLKKAPVAPGRRPLPPAKHARKPSPPPLNDALDRQKELIEKIKNLGGKKTAKSYELDLADGMNIDPIPVPSSRGKGAVHGAPSGGGSGPGGGSLSDSSSDSDDSDSSSDSGSESDPDNSSDESANEDSFPGTSKNKQKNSSHNGATKSSFQDLKSDLRNSTNFGATSSQEKLHTSRVDSPIMRAASPLAAAASAAALSAPNSPSSTKGPSVSKGSSGWSRLANSQPAAATTSVHTAFQQFQKRAHDRLQYEQQMKAREKPSVQPPPQGPLAGALFAPPSRLDLSDPEST